MKDNKLVSRLLTYAKPYKWLFVVVFAMMMMGTFLDLARPLIIGNAVDLFMEGYKTPFVAADSADADFVVFRDEMLRHYKEGDPETQVSQVLQYDNQYFWIEDIAIEDVTYIQELAPEAYSQCVQINNGQLQVQGLTQNYIGQMLGTDELKVLRALDYKPLLGQAGLFLIVLVGSFGLAYVQALILQKIGQKIILAIRGEIYDKMLNLPFRYYHDNPIGKLVTRVTNDTETLNEMYTNVIVNLLKHTLFIIGIVVMMFKTHAPTAIFVVMLVPFVVGSTYIFKYYSRKAYRDTRNYITEMNSFLSEHLSGMRMIQVFGREKAKVTKMTTINDNLYKAGIKEMVAFSIFKPFIFFLSCLGIAGVLWIGGKSVLQGAMTVGALIVMVSYTKDFFGPIEQLAESFNVLQSALASAEKIFSVLDEENEIVTGTRAVDSETFKGEIEFKNVWFAYQEENWILKDVSFKIEKGQKVAFVGATGAGKTSILSLICRYYDIQKGQILIDGIDIKAYQLQELRKQIGQVLQDVFMFTGDIKKNIRLGEEKITKAQIQEAARLVNAHEFIEAMPKGYDEEVVERGATLSTGQRQLISFARAVAFDPKIFILDEATSNIDTETETLIQDALTKVMEGRTTLMVAHRLSTIQHADNIIVLHKGCIRETGTHQDLLGQRGIYYHLYQLALQSQVMA
ncbi:MAG: ABC transporter ATP-binding protein [Cellulosilyticaceae bacterium]